MKIENILQRFSFISFLFKPPWFNQENDIKINVLLSFKLDFFGVDAADSVTYSKILETEVVLLHGVNTNLRSIINFF